MRKIALLLICGFLVSWGFLAHKTLQQIAIYPLPTDLGLFFYANQEYVVQHSIRPDVRRKDDKTEDSKHYLDMDANVFGPNYRTDIPHDFKQAVAKYSFDSLRKEGLVPWEVNRVYGRLVNAFKNELKDSVLFYAADLGHYVADSHVPLHTTKNHDGQLTNQKGMHVLWESLVPEAQLKNYALYQPQAAQYIAKPQDFIFEILLESHAMLPEMFKAETAVRQALGEEKSFKMVERYGKMQRYYTDEFIQAFADKLGVSIQGRMIQSSHRVASFWYSAWKDAGSPAWVTKEITAEKKAAFESEKAQWKANALISTGKLISLHK